MAYPPNYRTAKVSKRTPLRKQVPEYESSTPFAKFFAEHNLLMPKSNNGGC
jgi:hypothetical protein